MNANVFLKRASGEYCQILNRADRPPPTWLPWPAWFGPENLTGVTWEWRNGRHTHRKAGWIMLDLMGSTYYARTGSQWVLVGGLYRGAASGYSHIEAELWLMLPAYTGQSINTCTWTRVEAIPLNLTWRRLLHFCGSEISGSLAWLQPCQQNSGLYLIPRQASYHIAIPHSLPRLFYDPQLSTATSTLNTDISYQ